MLGNVDSVLGVLTMLGALDKIGLEVHLDLLGRTTLFWICARRPSARQGSLKHCCTWVRDTRQNMARDIEHNRAGKIEVNRITNHPI